MRILKSNHVRSVVKMSEMKPNINLEIVLLEWDVIHKVLPTLYTVCKENIASCRNRNDMGVFAERFERNGVVNFAGGFFS